MLSATFAFSSLAYAETTLKTPIVDIDFEYSSGNFVIETGDNAAIQGGTSNINIVVTGNGQDEQGNLVLTVDSAHGVQAELNDSSNIIATAEGDITITAVGTTSNTNGDGINVASSNRGSLTFSAGNSLVINAESKSGDGIYVGESSAGDILILANQDEQSASLDNGIVINAENNGVDHRGGQKVELDSKGGSNRIVTVSGDGLRNVGTGTINLKGSGQYDPGWRQRYSGEWWQSHVKRRLQHHLR